MTAVERPDAAARRRAALELLTIPYCPAQPTKTQAQFLLDLRREVLYGGAAGGGKSIALLMGALQFIEVPDYAAVIFRRRLSDLMLPSGLIPVAHTWLFGQARWSTDEHTWHFRNGARLVFGYLDTINDMFRYQGDEFQYIGFDELTQFPEDPYRYLFSRLRRPAGARRTLSQVPLRMRVTTNPGGEGHDWVRTRFIEPWLAQQHGEAPVKDRSFHPARLDDNPHLDRHEHRQSLSNLTFGLRRQLLDGDWDIRPHGGVFQRGWFPIVDRSTLPEHVVGVRAWDLAATEARPGNDPDYTVGIRVDLDQRTKTYYVTDVVRLRASSHQVEQRIRATAETDGHAISIVIEEEPGSAGKALVAHYSRDVLDGWAVRGERPTGDKVTRAQLAASRAEAGDIRLVAAPWNTALLDELEVFPQSHHDDQVDALALALTQLAARRDLGMDPEVFAQINDDLRQENHWNI